MKFINVQSEMKINLKVQKYLEFKGINLLYISKC